MRDIKRIPKLLKLFEELWYLNPDMRFTQIIDLMQKCMKAEGIDPFYVEDQEIINTLQVILDLDDFDATGENN